MMDICFGTFFKDEMTIHMYYGPRRVLPNRYYIFFFIASQAERPATLYQIENYYKNTNTTHTHTLRTYLLMLHKNKLDGGNISKNETHCIYEKLNRTMIKVHSI